MDSALRPSSSPRKVRFPPKGPPRREVKLPQARREAVQEGDADDDEKRDLLMKEVKKHLTRGQPKAEKKSQVAFSHGVASSTPIRTYGGLQADEIANDKGLKGSTSDDDRDLFSLPSGYTADGILENDKDSLFKKKKREYKEPWDYDHSYYPTGLPWRKPFSGDPELLDKDEFGEATSAMEYDESTVNPASDLGLLEKVDDAKMFVFQLPANIPSGKQPTSTDRMETAGSLTLPGSDSPAISKNKVIGGSYTPGGIVSPIGKGKEVHHHMSVVSAGREGEMIADRSTSSSVRGNASKKVCSLEELPAECSGKLLVYKSGVVKLKLGDILFDVSSGCDSTFAQEIMAVNTNEKQCCALGEPNNKWAIVSPDIDSLLE